MQLIDSMRGIIDQLRSENAMLKKNSQTNMKYMALLKESKKMKLEVQAGRQALREIESIEKELKNSKVINNNAAARALKK